MFTPRDALAATFVLAASAALLARTAQHPITRDDIQAIADVDRGGRAEERIADARTGR
jgi:hypothetical protein